VPINAQVYDWVDPVGWGLWLTRPFHVYPTSDASADLFGQGDDDARGAAQVAEQVDALVLGHLAEELGARDWP
jgi:hypothetical protein